MPNAYVFCIGHNIVSTNSFGTCKSNSVIWSQSFLSIVIILKMISRFLIVVTVIIITQYFCSANDVKQSRTCFDHNCSNLQQKIAACWSSDIVKQQTCEKNWPGDKVVLATSSVVL